MSPSSTVLLFILSCLSSASHPTSQAWNSDYLSCTRRRRRRAHLFVSGGASADDNAATASTPSCATSTVPDDECLFSNTKPPPYLAVITEPDCCENDEKLKKALDVLKRATSGGGQVDLVSVRIARPPCDDDKTLAQVEERVRILIRALIDRSEQQQLQLLQQKNKSRPFQVMVSSDWISLALECQAHGIHFKESHRHLIPSILEMSTHKLWIGTSAHSVESAVRAFTEYPVVDYFMVGTCYHTTSHPEKVSLDYLEGPALPGQVARALQYFHNNNNTSSSPPVAVLAIGGIQSSNCAEPIALGAQGVATIRAILCAKDPAAAVDEIKQNMIAAWMG